MGWVILSKHKCFIIIKFCRPIVAVFSIFNNTKSDFQDARRDLDMLTLVSQSWKRDNVRVIVLFLDFPPEVDYVSQHLTNESRLGLYPVNAMRNIAMDESLSNWVFPLDMDFVPSASLYESLVTLHLPRVNLVFDMGLARVV